MNLSSQNGSPSLKLEAYVCFLWSRGPRVRLRLIALQVVLHTVLAKARRMITPHRNLQLKPLEPLPFFEWVSGYFRLAWVS
jgi:hypothetical protein